MSNEATEPVTAAERMRRLRTRQRNGLRYMRILLHETHTYPEGTRCKNFRLETLVKNVCE
jgi:hypothetical protein